MMKVLLVIVALLLALAASCAFLADRFKRGVETQVELSKHYVACMERFYESERQTAMEGVRQPGVYQGTTAMHPDRVKRAEERCRREAQRALERAAQRRR